ncbi:MAG: FAD-binding protein [Actinobacteria bacterium]|nr:FAD-binding protein [Actinomycetota bacterium]
MALQRLSGWGRTAWTVADLFHTNDVHEMQGIIDRSGPRGVIARGLGRSYGAAAQNAGGNVIEITAEGDPNGIDAFLDSATGELDVASSVSLDSILRMSVPRGWFVPVTPGTRFITVGGAIASDVHGKNHHFDGSFGQHVSSITLMLASGEIVEMTPQSHPDWFWATVGGMGLTGIVLRAKVRMLRIESSRVRVETERLVNFDAVCEAMSSDGADNDYRYSVCWIDLLATGSSMGRGVLTRGEHASVADVKDDDVLAYDPRLKVPAPGWVPNGLLNKWSIKAFNEVWYRKAPATRHVSIESIPQFFHPLDGVHQWNRLYGKQGFIQYQFIVPLDRIDVLRAVIETFSSAGVASFLAVLKRMGAQNLAPMSFPTEGWTLTLDMAAGIKGLPELLAKVDNMVLDAGGRHYLAKDSHVSPTAVRRGYPQLDEWMHTRDSMDPRGLWRSDLARRLGLVSAQHTRENE